MTVSDPDAAGTNRGRQPVRRGSSGCGAAAWSGAFARAAPPWRRSMRLRPFELAAGSGPIRRAADALNVAPSALDPKSARSGPRMNGRARRSAGGFFSFRHAAQVMENSGLRASIKPVARIRMGAGLSTVMLTSYRGGLGESIPHSMTMEPLACRG
jgi:hypothetical protein